MLRIKINFLIVTASITMLGLYCDSQKSWFSELGAFQNSSFQFHPKTLKNLIFGSSIPSFVLSIYGSNELL